METLQGTPSKALNGRACCHTRKSGWIFLGYLGKDMMT